MFGAFFARFQTRAIALLVVSTVVPAAIVGGYNVRRSRQVLAETIGTGMRRDGASHAATLSMFLKTVRADLVYLRGLPSLAEIVEIQAAADDNPESAAGRAARSRLSDVYLSFARSRPYYQQIRYLDASGQELVRVDRRRNTEPQIVPPASLQDKGDRDYFTEAMSLEADEFYVSEINLNRENGQIEQPYNPVLRYAIAVRDAGGNVRGVLVANLSGDVLFEPIVEEVNLAGGSQELIIVNERGSYLYHQDETKRWGEDLGHDQTIADEVSAEKAAALLDDGSGLLQDSDYLTFHQSIYPDPATREQPFFIIYRAAKDRLFAPIDRTTRIAVIVSIVTATGFISIGIGVVKQLVDRLQGVTAELGRFSERVAETIAQSESNAYQQSVAVREATATMDRLNTTSQQSAEEARSAARQVQQSLERVRSSLSNNSEALEAMGFVRETVDDLSKQIALLDNRAGEIGGISGLVGDLANQTNMLALNAAVEAVRAGAHGRGFSVVAAEIRKLSDASQQSGTQIHGIVSEIQRDIQTTLRATEAGSRNVETGVDRVRTIAEVLQELAAMMDTIAQNAQAIAENSSEQAVATQQVTSAMVDLTGSTARSAEQLQSLKDGTEEITSAASSLQENI